MSRPGPLAGALVGGLLAAALTATLYLAFQLVGLPFLPFEAFDWTARVLPGTVITPGIDAMVTVNGSNRSRRSINGSRATGCAEAGIAMRSCVRHR